MNLYFNLHNVQNLNVCSYADQVVRVSLQVVVNLLSHEPQAKPLKDNIELDHNDDEESYIII